MSDRMFSRSLRQLQPMLRTASLSRGRHFMVPAEFRVFNRLVEDFFREPLFTPRFLTPVEPYSVQSGMRFFKEDGKLVAQMRLPQNVKPEDVKVGGVMCLYLGSFRPFVLAIVYSLGEVV